MNRIATQKMIKMPNPTHQAVEDANIIRAMPHMTVLNPADGVEAAKMVRALADFKGPAYLRINRGDLPVFTDAKGDYIIGKIYPVNEGGDIAIFATGVMVSKAMEAAEKLAKEGIQAQVLNVSTLKPLLQEEVLLYAKGKKAVITAEESVQTGGLGGAIAALIINETNVPFRQVAIDDEFGTSAHGYEELLVKYKLSAADVYQAVKEALQ